MTIAGVLIENTFAEAFDMRAARLVITARDRRWAIEAATKLTGFATSVIACKCEAAIEREVGPEATPDGRPGVAVLCFAMDSDGLTKRLVERIGQTVLTCPTASCFDGLPDAESRAPAGRVLRVFGDGFQISKVVAGRRYWRVPVMGGECLLSETFGIQEAIGGGNFLILAESETACLAAADAAVAAITGTADVILPFPGGIVRSGSKVGSRRYRELLASTNEAYCPTLRPLTETKLNDEVNCVLEIVIDGLSADAIRRAMKAGITAACRPGVKSISAGNYGGSLGRHHFQLREVMGAP